jgi:hypothetical protein
MDSFNDAALSAYFPGLVDICQNDDGQLVYAIIKDNELVFSPEFATDTEMFSIPERKHFQFTIPRAAEVMRYFGRDDESLYDDLLSYLKRFSALDDAQWAIVGHYVFLTYIHDHPGIDYCPYILFYAVPERGKSRTGKSVIYVAFRGIHLVELREATIFRFSQYQHGTLFFDLQDISKKAERGGCDDILLLRAEKGAKCCRILFPDQGPFNDTVYYDIYGPTIIASNEQLHKILETRCLPIIMPNRPGNYANPRPELGLELKERLTAWRAKHLNATFPDFEPIDGISGRLWDLAKSMFFINSLLPVERATLEHAILAIAGERDESRHDTLEGRLVAIIKDITAEGGLDRFVEWTIKTNDIRNRFNLGRPDDRHVSPTWIGMKLKSMSLRNRHLHGFSEIKFTATEYVTLLQQYGFSGRDLQGSTKALPNLIESNQDVLNLGEPGRDLTQVQAERFTFNGPEELDIYYTTLKALKAEGGRSRDDMEKLCLEAVEQWRRDHDLPF